MDKITTPSKSDLVSAWEKSAQDELTAARILYNCSLYPMALYHLFLALEKHIKMSALEYGLIDEKKAKDASHNLANLMSKLWVIGQTKELIAHEKNDLNRHANSIKTIMDHPENMIRKVADSEFSDRKKAENLAILFKDHFHNYDAPAKPLDAIIDGEITPKQVQDIKKYMKRAYGVDYTDHQAIIRLVDISDVWKNYPEKINKIVDNFKLVLDCVAICSILLGKHYLSLKYPDSGSNPARTYTEQHYLVLLFDYFEMSLIKFYENFKQFQDINRELPKDFEKKCFIAYHKYSNSYPLAD